MNGRIDVLHVIDALRPGGAERVLVDLVGALAERGVRVGVCVTRSEAPLAADLPPGVPLHRLGRRSTWDPGPARAFVRLCREAGVRVLHAHGRGSFRFAALAAVLGRLRCRVVLHDHSGSVVENPRVPASLRLLAGRIDRYVGASGGLVAWAGERLGIPPERALFLANTVDPARFRGAAPLDEPPFARAEGELVAVMVANLRAEKDHPLLLRALARSRVARERMRVVLVGGGGGGSYAAEVRRLAEALGIGDRVVLAGGERDVPRVLASAGAGLLASRWETGPLALLEYMAAGLPFVATRTGEAAHAADAAGLPFVVAPGDEAGYAAALDALAELDPAGRAALGARGRRLVEARFDRAACVDALTELYRGMGVPVPGDPLRPTTVERAAR